MVPNPKIVILLCISLAVFVGCATVRIDLSMVDKNVIMTDNIDRPYTIIKKLNSERKAYFAILGFIKIANPDFTDIIKTELTEAQGDAVINTNIEIEYDLVDTFVPYGIGAAGWAVLGPVGLNLSYVFTTQTYRIQGDVIRYTP